MPKEFYTERDIEDMFKRGILSLQVSEQVVLTELAYEKANRLGMHLLREKPLEPPAGPSLCPESHQPLSHPGPDAKWYAARKRKYSRFPV